MNTSKFKEALREIAKARDNPSWLLPCEAIEFSVVEPRLESEDGLQIQGTLVSAARWRVAQDEIGGKILRIFAYTGRKGLLIEVIDHCLSKIESRLRCTINHPHQDMAFQALNDPDVLMVFMDRLLLRGEIAVDDPPEQALGFARSIVAPFIFGGWEQTRWPVNDDFERTIGDLRLFGSDGPRVFAKRNVDWQNCTIRIQGDYALVE